MTEEKYKEIQKKDSKGGRKWITYWNDGKYSENCI